MKNYIDGCNNFCEDLKDNSVKNNLNKYEYDLFHEESNVPGKIVQIKKIGSPKKGEKWKVLQDGKVALTIDGMKLTSKERSFLYTPEGISFLIKEFKSGPVTITSLKKNIKNILSKKD